MDLDGNYVRVASRRFWAKVDKNGPNGCWLWTASIGTGGYGQFSYGGRSVSAHRWSYLATTGPTPSGLHLDHLCRVRHCVNPLHLEPVTCQENLRRGVGVGLGAGKAEAAKTHCPHGHEYTPENTGLQPSRYCRICARAKYRRLRAKKKAAA